VGFPKVNEAQGGGMMFGLLRQNSLDGLDKGKEDVNGASAHITAWDTPFPSDINSRQVVRRAVM
jgi:hypothetical protein